MWCDLETTTRAASCSYNHMCINKSLLPVPSPTTKPPHMTQRRYTLSDQYSSLSILVGSNKGRSKQ